jgi:hypothetical protein
MADFEKLKLTKPGIIPIRIWNQLVESVQSAQLTAIVGGTIARTPNGTSLWIRPADSAAAAVKPFQLIVTSSGGDPKIRVIPSTLAGGSSTDVGFAAGDDPPYLLDPAEGVLVGGITWDPTVGPPITSRWLEIKDHFPTSDEVPDGTDYVEIGTVHWVADDSDAGGHWTVTNSRYGPINASICRIWFAAEPPFYGATFYGDFQA